MQLDILTLLVMASINLFTVSFALPVLMGPRVSIAARCAQLSVSLQMLGWVSIIGSGYVLQPVLTTLSIVLFGAGHWLMHRALGGWLGHHSRPDKYRKRSRRPDLDDWLGYAIGGKCLLVLLVLAPTGYALGYANYPFRVGWANLCLAAMFLIVARATLTPLKKTGRGWRWLLCGSQVGMALLTLGRGVMGIFFSDQYPNFLASNPVSLVASIGVNVALVLSAMAVLGAWREESEGRLRTLAMTDALTGLLNRRGWTERAEAMFANAQRYQQPLTLMMLDLDHFKRINDVHGHEVGDQALKLFSRLLRETRRTGDLIGRLGGEEFCIVLANTHRSASIGFDHRLRTVLAERAEKDLGFAMDFSAGVAVLKEGDGTLAGLLARADQALYKAKADGRGRLVQSEGGAGQTVI